MTLARRRAGVVGADAFVVRGDLRFDAALLFALGAFDGGRGF